MPNAADILADETTRHAITVLRVAAGQRASALGVIQELFKELSSQAAKFAGVNTPNGAKFRALEAEAGRIIKAAYAVIADRQAKDLEKIALNEATFAAKSLGKAIGVDIFSSTINPKVLQTIAAGKIIEGNSASDWWRGQSNSVRNTFSREMSNGILRGETTPQLVKRVMGAGISTPTDATPGMKKKAEREATALVRTSVQAVSNTARIESFREMKTVKGLQWLATLDSRTTPICIALDKKQWRFPDMEPIGHSKVFPGSIAHMQCRSTQTPVTYSWEELSGKKLPELDGKTIQKAIEEKLEAQGEPPEKIAGVLANARASMDGQVSKAHTFETWAEQKGSEFITEVLGPGKYELWNAGQITFNDLTDQNNRPLTIPQLQAATKSGKTPPETLGKGFKPYVPDRTTLFQVAAVTEKATATASLATAAALETGRVIMGELMTAQATHGGPYVTAQAALDAMKDEDPADMREAYQATLEQAAKDWLAALDQGLAGPDTTRRADPLLIQAYKTHGKGKPRTPATWRKVNAEFQFLKRQEKES